MMVTEATIRERLGDNHPGDVTFGHAEVEYLLDRLDGVRERVEALLNAEEIVLRAPLSRQERACRKATRDAYRLVLELLEENR